MPEAAVHPPLELAGDALVPAADRQPSVSGVLCLTTAAACDSFKMFHASDAMRQCHELHAKPFTSEHRLTEVHAVHSMIQHVQRRNLQQHMHSIEQIA